MYGNYGMRPDQSGGALFVPINTAIDATVPPSSIIAASAVSSKDLDSICLF